MTGREERRELEQILDELLRETREGRLETRHALREVYQLMAATQADVDALAANFKQLASDMGDGLTKVEAEISGLQSANPGIDLSGLRDAFNDVQTVHDKLASDVASIPAGPAANPQDPTQVNANQPPVPDVTNTNVQPDPQVPVVGQPDQQTQAAVDPAQVPDPSQPQTPNSPTDTPSGDPGAPSA